MNSVGEKSNKLLSLNANMIKVISIVAMTIDHVTWAVFPGYPREPLPVILHIIGRLAAPIMMYFMVEGYYHTRNIKKYIFRMFIFALVSHFPYQFAAFQDTLWETSVIWTFLMGLIALTIAKSTHPSLQIWVKVILITICFVGAFFGNWSTPGALAILTMGLTKGNFRNQMIAMVLSLSTYAIVYFFILDPLYAAIQMCVVLTVPVLYFYNGERGKIKGMKWFFYIYYPLHLVLVGLLKMYLS